MASTAPSRCSQPGPASAACSASARSIGEADRAAAPSRPAGSEAPDEAPADEAAADGAPGAEDEVCSADPAGDDEAAGDPATRSPRGSAAEPCAATVQSTAGLAEELGTLRSMLALLTTPAPLSAPASSHAVDNGGLCWSHSRANPLSFTMSDAEAAGGGWGPRGDPEAPGSVLGHSIGRDALQDTTHFAPAVPGASGAPTAAAPSLARSALGSTRARLPPDQGPCAPLGATTRSAPAAPAVVPPPAELPPPCCAGQGGLLGEVQALRGVAAELLRALGVADPAAAGCPAAEHAAVPAAAPAAGRAASPGAAPAAGAAEAAARRLSPRRPPWLAAASSRPRQQPPSPPPSPPPTPPRGSARGRPPSQRPSPALPAPAPAAPQPPPVACLPVPFPALPPPTPVQPAGIQHQHDLRPPRPRITTPPAQVQPGAPCGGSAAAGSDGRWLSPPRADSPVRVWLC
eukprot:TRINITY_DN36422_c0_g1_i1.p1 TRINITY_DN36422_c0_g1~~TRINITY_DN36422_c0_g1_i1.p1  ORF type:complete len:460 (+),score=48.22 TRINITY_DN36422_c0_g1_i1:89-1468(+)